MTVAFMNFQFITYKHKWPILTNGIIKVGTEVVDLGIPFKHDWRAQSGYPLGNTENCFPSEIDLKFQALSGQRFDLHYRFESLRHEIEKLECENNSILSLTLGIDPSGHAVIWLSDQYKANVIYHESCVPVDDSLIDKDWRFKLSMLEYIARGQENDFNDEYSLPCSEKQMTRRMKQYKYRYQVIISDLDKGKEEGNNAPASTVYDLRIDGSYDKKRSNSLTSFHAAGKPEIIGVDWEVGKREYSAYFWLDETLIAEVFERFYGTHPETKTDFIIRIDAENKKYELSLFRQGLKEPVKIPESAYQLIVFKNKFEDYRSDNYNQPRGAWIW